MRKLIPRTSMRAATTRARSAGRGFSLVEMMVSVLLICIGLLGLAKVQGMSMASTKTAASRGAAAYLASSLAGAMRANPAFWRDTAPTTPMTLISAGVRNVTSIANCALDAPASTTPHCTPAEQAAFDVDDWTRGVAEALPLATATIECPPIPSPTIPRHCDLNIEWQENVQAVNAATEGAVAAAGVVRTNFALAVWP